jgi:hypothetical protein
MSDTPAVKAFNFSSDTGRRATGSVFFFLNGQKIQCVDEIDGLTFFEFAQVAGGAFGSEGAEPNLAALAGAAGGVIDLMRAAIIEEDWPLFVKEVKAPKSGVGPEQLAEIMGWLMEQYVESPTT